MFSDKLLAFNTKIEFTKMNSQDSAPILLEDGLDLGKLFTSGSILNIYEDYDLAYVEPENKEVKRLDYIGEPVTCFEEFQKQLAPLDKHGFIKKKILEEGGGLPLDKKFTVSIAFSGYWENSYEPFDFNKIYKPLVVNLNENGLLPGVQMAIESMLVGETAVFLLSYKVMYGEMGVPPRIKPKADCVFYIKLLKSIITPKEGHINFSEPNIFRRVQHEVKLLYSSGLMLYKTNNFGAASHVFKKAVNMLHKCRLADESEEKIQENYLKKLYINLAICYNEIKLPLKACVACNELNRLNCLWNNGKALFQNAKALRMIGQFDEAEKKLKQALKLNPDDSISAELKLLNKLKESCNKKKLISSEILTDSKNVVREKFKRDVDDLIKTFKENVDLCKFTLPGELNVAEKNYIKEACIRENLHFTEIDRKCLLDKDNETDPIESKIDLFH